MLQYAQLNRRRGLNRNIPFTTGHFCLILCTILPYLTLFLGAADQNGWGKGESNTMLLSSMV